VQQRLQKILSAAGIASRRAAEAYITDGRVSVNGQTVTALGSKADPDTDDIRVDGRRVKTASRRLYILMYKPRGYITSRSDPQRRPTVIDLLAKGGVRDYVYPVGRLDYESEGLLLLTSDGDLAAQLTHPSHEVEREYQVKVLGVPDEHDMQRLAKGIVIDGRRTQPAEVKLLKVTEGTDAQHALLSIVVKEGRNRQVRNMCEAIGHPVDRLRRVRIGPIADEHIRPGEFRELDSKEVAALRKRLRPEREPSAAVERDARDGAPGGGAPGALKKWGPPSSERSGPPPDAKQRQSLRQQRRPKADQVPHRTRGR
jgi:23S rRNA pseudouridine2605 synthase